MALRASISLSVLQASASVARATAATNYNRVAATGIWTDSDSLNQMLKDELPLADVRFNVVAKVLTDAYTVEDTSYRGVEKGFTADSISFAETFAKAVSYNRDFTDAFTLDDLASIDKAFYGNKGNIFAFTDLMGLTYDKLLTDTYTVSDVFVLVVEYARNFSDTVSLVELQGKAVGKTETDSMSLSSAPEVGTTLGKTDLFSISDTSVTTLVKSLNDAFALDDSALVNKDFYGNKGNVLGFSEVFARAVAFVRSFDDTVSLPDVPAVTYSAPKEDSVSFSDEILIGWFYERVISDLLRVHDQVPSTLGSGLLNSLDLNSADDNVRTFINPGVADGVGFSDIQVSSINKTLTDIFSLDDSLLVDKDYFGHKGNAFGFSDVISKTLTFVRAFVDNTTLSDTRDVSAQKVIADNTLFSDLNVLSTSKGVVEALSLSEVRGMQLSKALTDAFALDDATLVNKNYSGVKGNVFGVSDVFDRSVAYARSFQETVSTSDTNSVTFNSSISDTMSIPDILERIVGYNRDFEDSTTLNSVNALALGKAFADTISSVTDVYAITQMKNPSDTIDFTDSTRSTIEKAVIDGIGLDDSTLVNKNYFGNKGNIMSISDVVVVDLVVSNTINSSALNIRTLN